MQILISFGSFLFLFLIIFIGLFIFWGNMYRQGFRNEKIWNNIIVLSVISLMLGKILYLISSNKAFELNWVDFFTPPFLVAGIIIGAVFVTSVFCRANNWSVFRVGDYIALSLNFFFLAFNLYSAIFLYITQSKYNIYQLGIVFLYLVLYIYLSRSIKTQVFSGYIFTVFLIITAVIEIVGIVLQTRTFQFSLTLYFAIIIFAVINLFDRYKEIKIMQTNLPEDFIDEMKERLEEKKEEISEELGELSSTDAFVTDDARSDHNAEPSEEAEELEEHYDNVASKNVLLKAKDQVVKALNRIKRGTYGVDEKTGKPISKDRLKADPSATTNVEKDK